MLVLTRKRQEQVRIGDQITLTILKIKGNTVRVGIDAPRTVRVVRGELPPKQAESRANGLRRCKSLALEISSGENSSDAQGEDAHRLQQLVRKVTQTSDAITCAF